MGMVVRERAPLRPARDLRFRPRRGESTAPRACAGGGGCGRGRGRGWNRLSDGIQDGADDCRAR